MMKVKLGKNQVLRPSGVIASKDGKYFYWVCSISGVKTFASAERFKTVLVKFGNDENRLVKEFVCRPAQKYLDAGYKAEDIRKLADSNKGKLAKFDVKPKKPDILKRKRRKGLKSFAIGTIKVKEQTATGSVEVVEKPIYPWQGNPDYFTVSKDFTPATVEEITLDACLYPGRHLDDECKGCPVYDRCRLPTKFTEKDWKKGHKKAPVVVKEIDPWKVE